MQGTLQIKRGLSPILRYFYVPYFYGVIEAILTLYMMKKGFIAPTLNLDQVDDRCAMIRHTPRLMETKIQCAAVQDFAFGGINTSLILKRFSLLDKKKVSTL